MIEQSAIFSPNRTYRYELRRRWADGPTVAFIGLNPSTADENLDDPTIRRCVGFAKREGFGELVMLNLFAYRSTDPRQLLAVKDPVGPANDVTLIDVTDNVALTIAAWGVHGAIRNRGWHVVGLVAPIPLKALGLTKGGYPRHPLYLPADAPLVDL